MQSRIWKQASVKLIPSAIFIIGGALIASHYSKLAHRTLHSRLISLGGDLIFILFALIFLHILTRVIRRIITGERLGQGRAASLQFILRLIGYLVIFLATLNFLNVPLGKLLLGGAVLGVILGVAAQQALANFFASIILIISHPFSVGDQVVITAGALGGQHKGIIKDIGLTHTKIKEEDGDYILLPNAAILSGAAIRKIKRVVKKDESTPASK
jgi:small-conductance mechanosensitive channel